MARVSLEKDRELSKLGLLRVSVVADLLGVAPKTVNIWLKDATNQKIRGVKYLDWTLVRKTRESDVQILCLPVTSQAAHVMWEVRFKDSAHILLTNAQAVSVVNASSALDKAKMLLGASTKPKIENFQSAENIEAQIPLEIPPIVEPVVLTIPQEYKQAQVKPLTKGVVAGACSFCGHSLTDFHNGAGCLFAKHTVAACNCKHGV